MPKEKFRELREKSRNIYLTPSTFSPRAFKVFVDLFINLLVGNQLGDAVEEVQELMTELGKIDCLGSFEENEEPDSDEEEKEEEESDQEEKKEEEDKENIREDEKISNGIDDLSLQIKGMGLNKDSPLLKDDLKTNGQLTEVG